MKQWFWQDKISNKSENSDKEDKLSISEERQLVSGLIFKVLTGSICIREALKLFPKDSADPSVHCAWHALVHCEADENYRKTDKEYAEEQDNYLEMIGFTLRDGHPLPQNIIASYKEYYEMALVPRSEGIISWLKSLIRFTI